MNKSENDLLFGTICAWRTPTALGLATTIPS
jgi:hypothetical protein